MASLSMKRMARERATLETPNEDYFVFFENDNLRLFHAYVIGPKDTLYEHKFIKLQIEIPDRYPLVPPKCTFMQHTGSRIHPNLYVDGKVCLSILGTWPGEPWALSMTIHTVLITIRSLLDNEPYKHEPEQDNHPAFNDLVQYGSWTWLMLAYIQYERNEDARAFLERHISQNSANMMEELHKQYVANVNVKSFHSPYDNAGDPRPLVANYPKLMRDVEICVQNCRAAHAERQSKTV